MAKKSSGSYICVQSVSYTIYPMVIKHMLNMSHPRRFLTIRTMNSIELVMTQRS